MSETYIPAELRRIAGLVANLDSSDFAVREKAAADLVNLGESAKTGLRQALAARPSLEVRRRIESVLHKLETTQNLRNTRATEMLELMNTAEARELLQSLAAGSPEAHLTLEAKASLERLAKRPQADP